VSDESHVYPHPECLEKFENLREKHPLKECMNKFQEVTNKQHERDLVMQDVKNTVTHIKDRIDNGMSLTIKDIKDKLDQDYLQLTDVKTTIKNHGFWIECLQFFVKWIIVISISGGIVSILWSVIRNYMQNG